MSNRTTIDMMKTMEVGAVAKLPIDELAMLVEDLDQLSDELKSAKSLLDTALAARFGEAAQQKRRLQAKDTGTVRLHEGDFIIVAEQPKRVEWDQAKLPAILDAMPEDEARHFARVKVEIDERKFIAATPAIQARLAAARTIKPSKQTFKFERAA